MENNKKSKRPSIYRIISVIVIVILAVLFTFPLYWIITGSFKTNAAINSTTPIWWPLLQIVFLQARIPPWML